MEIKNTAQTKALDFIHLPAYAQYLLTHRLNEVVKKYMEVSVETDLPLLRRLQGIPAELKEQAALPLVRNLLTSLAENQPEIPIDNLLTNWQHNQLPFLDKYEIAGEDITKLSFIRKRVFLHFLPEYAHDTSQMLQVIEELDTFLMHYDLAASDIYINLMQARINDHSHLISKVNNTLPGAVYIFDIVSFRNIYANDKIADIFGYTPEELNEMGSSGPSELTHPEDINVVSEHLSQVADMPDGKITSYKYRIKQKDGTYKWIRNYEAVFKRNADGKVIELIAISLDIDQEKKTAELLRQSKEHLLEAQAISHLGNWTWNLDTNELVWSDELDRIYELSPGREPITFEKFLTHLHPEDRDYVVTQLNESIASRKPFNFYHRIIVSDGRVKTIHARGQLAEGKNNELFGTAQDVTEQYKVQTELKEKENFIRKIADATPSIIASYNVNTGKYVYVSEGIEKLLGYLPEDVIKAGMEFFTGIIHPEDLGPVMQRNQKALDEANNAPGSKEAIVEFTYRMKHKNGQYRWFHTYGTVFDRNASGRVEHILNISLDVTDSIEATKKIKEQERFIQQVADASPTILYLFDVEANKFAYLNREIFYVLDYTPEEILERGDDAVSQLYHPDDLAVLPERKGSDAKFQHMESMMQYECRLKTRKGDFVWFLVREIVFKKSEDGKVQQIVGAALDINQRKEMEKTLLQNSFQLEQSNSSLEEFAYVASHDLKEPLRKISTFGDRMSATQMDKLSDDGKLYLKKIVDASHRMQLMIDDLLSVSMISGNRSFEPFSLQQILEDARLAVEFKIEQKNAIIKSTELPVANIVPSQFRQLFQNLLSNSLKFVREGVQPVISITHRILQPADVAHMQLPKANSYLELIFEDNGIGFENEFAGKIFQIFQRLHGRSEYEGTGIGLAICKKIVEHHGGVIFAGGKPGEGAKFTIILPR